MAGPLADYVVSLGQDGRIACRGTVSDALKKDKTLAKDVAKGARALKDDEKRIDVEEPDEVAKPGDGKLILSEEIAEGHVSWDAGERLFFPHFGLLCLIDVPPVKLFIEGLGGSHPILFWILFAGGLVFCDAVLTIQTWFMGYWAEQYTIYPPEEVKIA